MKKYIALLLILLSISISLGYLFYNKYQFINAPVTEKIKGSINKLVSKDKDLNLSLMQLGYGIDNNYDKIMNNVREISSLKKGILKDIDKSSTPLINVKKQFIKYETLNSSKMDLVESFKTSNSTLLNSANFSPYIGSVITRELNKIGADNDSNFVASFNGDLINYIRNPNSDTLESLKGKLENLAVIVARYEYEEVFGVEISQYLAHVKHVLKHMGPTRIYLKKTTEVDTANAILSISSAMQDKVDEFEKELSQLRKFSGIFGIILFLTFVALLMKIKQLFSGKGSKAVLTLNEKINKITSQVQQPLKFLNSNLNNIDVSYQAFQTTIESLDDVIVEAKKPQKNSSKMSEMVSKSLNDYARLKSTGTIERTQNMIKGTTVGVDEIANLILKLKEESEKEI